MSAGRFLGGLVLGGALGAIIGLLLAPRPGRETRSIIKEEFERRVDETSHNIKEKASELTSEVGHRVDDLKHRAKDIAQDLERVGQDTWDKVSHLPHRAEETTS